jgi:integrase
MIIYKRKKHIKKDSSLPKKIFIKKIYEYPIITNTEFNLLLNELPDYHPYKVFLGLMAIECLRPVEIANLKWNAFKFENNQITELIHTIYKPKNRMGKHSINCYYKETKKPMFSKWLSNQIIGYYERYPQLPLNKVFPFKNGDSVYKWLKQLRKKKKDEKEFNFLKDKNLYNIKEASGTKYRINLYCLRRFSFTFHYWITYNQDIVTLSKTFGHEKVETTYEHYVFPKESIGLTDEMIKNKINIDQFIQLKGKNQTTINEYNDKIINKKIAFIPGQRTLNFY